MEEMNLEYLGIGMKDFTKMFSNILDMGGHNLNQYIDGDTMGLPEDVSDEFAETLKDFIDVVPMQVRQIEDRKSFWKSFEQMQDYEKNDKFIKWLKQYVERVLKSWDDAAFINSLTEDKLKDMTIYCFENCILKFANIKKMDIPWDAEQLNVLRNILFTYFDMVIMYQYTVDYAFENVQRRFGINNSCNDIFQSLLAENEDKLWKIMVSKQLVRLQRRLDEVMDIVC